MRIFAFRRQPLTATSSDRHHFSTKGGYKGVTRMAYSPSLWLMAIGWWNEINQCRELKLNLTLTWGVCMSLDSGMHWSQNQWYCDDKLRKEWIQSSKEQTHAESKHSFKEVSVSHAQLAHFSTLAEEKHMLLILNFSTLTFITNARTAMPFARLHSQMVCTQSEPAELPQHMFVQILVQVGGDRKWGRWTCSERGACSLNLPRPSSLWAEETLFLSVFIFFWGLFSSPTLFAATGQQPACSWFPFSAEQ
jgi:hypothetical protein